MKDIAQGQLDRGLEEVDRLLAKQVSAGRLTVEASHAVRARITQQLDYSCFGEVELVIEAVVENLAVKHRVLTELERLVAADTIVATTHRVCASTVATAVGYALSLGKTPIVVKD